MEYSNINFQIMRDGMIEHFKTMSQSRLFRVNVDPKELWELYLDSFPEEIKGIYREAAWHDCTTCRRFFLKMANVVSFNNGEISTLFGYDTIPEYQDVFNALDAHIKANSQIQNVFLTSRDHFGINHNFEGDSADSTMRHDHFYLEIPERYIRNGVKVGQDMSQALTDKEVFEGSLNSISLEAIDAVLDIIRDGNLYRGEQWTSQLESFRKYKIQFNDVSYEDKNNWLWITSAKAGTIIARIKNHSIGVLLQDITDGKDLEYAVKRYEEIVAPSNYQRPKPLFTQAMLDNARAELEELGYIESIQRRYAVMSDLKISDVLFANRNLTEEIQDDIFAELSKDAVVKHKSFDHAQEMSANDFIENILPNAKEVSLYMDYNLISNFVSLISPKDPEAKSMFKWDNCMSWAYRNNLADSMKEQVKAMGGDVDVDLRFSIRWNDQGQWDQSDLDAHCTEPDGTEIYYSHKNSRRTGGWLDVDIIDPQKGVPAVENIRYREVAKMIPGVYKFRVHQFNHHHNNTGFAAEIEFGGNIHRFFYPLEIRQGNYIDVAEVTLQDGQLSINPLLDVSTMSQDYWNIKLNDFTPVSLICYSPNYWGDNAVGNKHLFFMLDGCKNDGRPNAWFNEYLNSELHDHRKVMEALGSKARVEESENQLSGVGFSYGRDAEVTLKVKDDNGENVIKVKF